MVWVIDRKNFKDSHCPWAFGTCRLQMHRFTMLREVRSQEILAQSSNATAKEYIKYLDKAARQTRDDQRVRRDGMDAWIP